MGSVLSSGGSFPSLIVAQRRRPDKTKVGICGLHRIARMESTHFFSAGTGFSTSASYSITA